MTTEPSASLVEAEQVDRDAAAALLERCQAGLWRDAGIVADGNDDGHRFVQAFARHRLEALRTQGDGETVLVPREPTEEMVAAAGPGWTPTMQALWPAMVRELWTAMLSVSPTQASSREEGE